MLFILRDWDRIWSLASGPEAHSGSDHAVDAAAAVGILSRIVLNAAGRDCIRRALAHSYPRGPRPVPSDVRGLRLELASRLRNREWILLAGPSHPGYKGVGGSGGTRAVASVKPEPEPEALVPLFDPVPPPRPAKDWAVVGVELDDVEVEPVETQAPSSRESAWEVESVEVDGEEAVPETLDPDAREPLGAWELESVTIEDEEVIPQDAEPQEREADGAWEVESVVVEDEEVLPEG